RPSLTSRLDIPSIDLSKRSPHRESPVGAEAATTVPMRRLRAGRWPFSLRALLGFTGRHNRNRFFLARTPARGAGVFRSAIDQALCPLHSADAFWRFHGRASSAAVFDPVDLQGRARYGTQIPKSNAVTVHSTGPDPVKKREE